MKLYLTSQNENKGSDTYDSMVVCAESEEAAIQILPSPFFSWNEASDLKCYGWASLPDNVNVEYIGEASNHLKAGVVCSSFNEG